MSDEPQIDFDNSLYYIMHTENTQHTGKYLLIQFIKKAISRLLPECIILYLLSLQVGCKTLFFIPSFKYIYTLLFN